MTDIGAALVKELRDETNVGMMECKRALIEANGDKARAVQILRGRGMAVAEKRASRTANQGVIASVVMKEGRVGSLVEVDCETDFVARNELFKAFARDLAAKAAETDGDLADEVKQDVMDRIAATGENIIVRRNIRFVLEDTGLVASYIHHGSTIGVLVELGCGSSETASNDEFIALAKDICMHIAASNPHYTDQTAVPDDVIAAEREIYAGQVKDKPPQIVEKIVDGKLRKFYEQVCLVDQPFVKDQDISAGALLKQKGAELNDTLTVRRFARFQVGEAV